MQVDKTASGASSAYLFFLRHNKGAGGADSPHGGSQGGVRGSHDRGGVRRSTQEHQRLLEMCIQLYDLLDVLGLVHELHLCHPPDVLERADLEMRRGPNRSPRALPMASRTPCLIGLIRVTTGQLDPTWVDRRCNFGVFKAKP